MMRLTSQNDELKNPAEDDIELNLENREVSECNQDNTDDAPSSQH